MNEKKYILISERVGLDSTFDSGLTRYFSYPFDERHRYIHFLMWLAFVFVCMFVQYLEVIRTYSWIFSQGLFWKFWEPIGGPGDLFDVGHRQFISLDLNTCFGVCNKNTYRCLNKFRKEKR